MLRAETVGPSDEEVLISDPAKSGISDSKILAGIKSSPALLGQAKRWCVHRLHLSPTTDQTVPCKILNMFFSEMAGVAGVPSQIPTVRSLSKLLRANDRQDERQGAQFWAYPHRLSTAPKLPKCTVESKRGPLRQATQRGPTSFQSKRRLRPLEARHVKLIPP